MSSAHSDMPVTQPNMFEHEIRSEQSVDRTPSSYIKERRAGRARAFAKASPLVMARYRKCLLEVGGSQVTFGAWAVTEAYIAKHGPLGKTERKALGDLFAKLLGQGVIVDAGHGKRPNGNIGPIYSLRKTNADNL